MQCSVYANLGLFQGRRISSTVNRESAFPVSDDLRFRDHRDPLKPKYTFSWVFVPDLVVSGLSSCLSVVVVSLLNLQDALRAAFPAPNTSTSILYHAPADPAESGCGYSVHGSYELHELQRHVSLAFGTHAYA